MVWMFFGERPQGVWLVKMVIMKWFRVYLKVSRKICLAK